MTTVGIRYCGGCNPRYDRTRMVQSLIRDFPEISFTYDTSVYCPLWITVNGCQVACASSASLPAGEIIHLTGSGDFIRLRKRLQTFSAKSDAAPVKRCIVGTTVSLQKTFTSADTEAFAQLTGDSNGIHTVSEVSSRGLFHRPVIHGILVSSLLSALMGTQLPGSGTVLMEEEVKYLHPVMPGDTITASIRFREYTEYKNFYTGIFDGTCVSADGTIVVTAVYRQMMSKRFFVI